MIVFFTGTGNSRHCAHALAQALQDEMLDAFHFLRDGIAAELLSDRPWVFVSPTYAWRLPRVFAVFLRSGSFAGSRDAYFVMTCGDGTGNAAAYNRALCAQMGLRCRGTLPVVMPENYIAMFDAPAPDEARRIVAAAAPALQEAAACIRAGRDFPALRPTAADRLRSGAVNAAFYRFFIKASPFTVSDACIGCGRCAQGCVQNNITLTDGRPVWGSRCTHCMACICGCPAAAIEYGKASVGRVRYCCPDTAE